MYVLCMYYVCDKMEFLTQLIPNAQKNKSAAFYNVQFYYSFLKLLLNIKYVNQILVFKKINFRY